MVTGGTEGLSRAALALAARWPLDRCPAAVQAWFAAPPPGRWLVLCSGGADSVALTLWLAGIVADAPSRLHVLHLDHGQRGAASAAEAALVADLCAALALPQECRRAVPPDGAGTEAALRAARGEVIGAVAAEQPTAGVFTGHQADDVMENLLLRLGRGSGLRGLSGLRPVQPMGAAPPRIRPLLELARAEVRAALTSAQVRWREDASNASPTFARNRLRAAVVGPWRTAVAERDLAAAVRRSHEALIEADHAVEQLAARVPVDRALPVASLRPLPRAVRRRVLERWARAQLATTPAATQIDRWLEALAASASGAWSVPGGTVRCDSAHFVFDRATPALAPFQIEAPGRVELPAGAALEATWIRLDAARRAAIRAGAFPPTTQVWLADLEFPLLVRSWQPGDRYRPLGAPGSKKLQDAFVDARISRPQRGRLPVVCRGDGLILWTPGLPPAKAHRIREKTIMALQLTYTVS